MKVTLHSLELKIPYQLFKRVKIAAAAMNITNSRFIREAIHDQLISVDFKINMSFFRALEREKKYLQKLEDRIILSEYVSVHNLEL